MKKTLHFVPTFFNGMNLLDENIKDFKLEVFLNDKLISSNINFKCNRPFNNTSYYVWTDSSLENIEAGMLITDINVSIDNNLKYILSLNDDNDDGIKVTHDIKIEFKNIDLFTDSDSLIYSTEVKYIPIDAEFKNHFYMGYKTISSLIDFPSSIFNKELRRDLVIKDEDPMFHRVYISETIALRPCLIEDSPSIYYIRNEDTPVHELNHHTGSFSSYHEEHIKNSLIGSSDDCKEFLEALTLIEDEYESKKVTSFYESTSEGIKKICNLYNKRFSDLEEIDKCKLFQIFVRVDDSKNYQSAESEAPSILITDLSDYLKENDSMALTDKIKIVFLKSTKYKNIEKRGKYKTQEGHYIRALSVSTVHGVSFGSDSHIDESLLTDENQECFINDLEDDDYGRWSFDSVYDLPYSFPVAYKELENIVNTK